MFSYIWPMALIVLANTFYQICTKTVPEGMNTFASLTITYLIGAVLSLVLFFITSKSFAIGTEIKKINWAPFVLGAVIVALEAGYIYAYKAGWQLSTTQIVQAALVAVIMILVGKFLYSEKMSWNKVVGILVCLGGLALINLKVK